MAEKVEKLSVNRDKDFMYYVKDASVWRVQRKQPGVQKGRPEKVADGTFQMDTNFIYFVDKDGDVSRAERAVGGQKRKKPARATGKTKVAPKKTVKKTATKIDKKAAKKGAEKITEKSKKAKKGSEKASEKASEKGKKTAGKKKRR